MRLIQRFQKRAAIRKGCGSLVFDSNRSIHYRAVILRRVAQVRPTTNERVPPVPRCWGPGIAQPFPSQGLLPKMAEVVRMYSRFPPNRRVPHPCDVFLSQGWESTMQIFWAGSIIPLKSNTIQINRRRKIDSDFRIDHGGIAPLCWLSWRPIVCQSSLCLRIHSVAA